MDPSVTDDLPRPEVRTPVLDLAPLRSLQDRTTSDGPLVTRIVELFRDQSRRYVDDLGTAAAAGDVDGFRVAAHTLKSNAGAVGLLRLAAVCLDGERRASSARDAPPSGGGLSDDLVRIAAAAATELRAGLAALDDATADDGSVRV